jgi:hypothetical protein
MLAHLSTRPEIDQTYYDYVSEAAEDLLLTLMTEAINNKENGEEAKAMEYYCMSEELMLGGAPVSTDTITKFREIFAKKETGTDKPDAEKANEETQQGSGGNGNQNGNGNNGNGNGKFPHQYRDKVNALVDARRAQAVIPVSEKWIKKIEEYVEANAWAVQTIENLQYGRDYHKAAYTNLQKGKMSVADAMEVYTLLMEGWRNNCGIPLHLLPNEEKIGLITEQDAIVYHRRHLAAYATHHVKLDVLKEYLKDDKNGNELISLVYNKIREDDAYYLKQHELWIQMYEKLMFTLKLLRAEKKEEVTLAPPPAPEAATAQQSTAAESLMRT